MVLTNFECWAHGDSNELASKTIIERRTNNTPDAFNTMALQSGNSIENSGPATATQSPNDGARNISHLSSNGYYGFVACNGDAGGESITALGGHSDVNNVDRRAADDVMDVELHSGSEEHHHNGHFDRRKRFYAGDEILEMQLTSPKRFRLDSDRDFLPNNDTCATSYVPNPTTMDHDDIPISSPVQNQPVSNFSNHHHSSAQSQSSHNIIQPVNTFKSNSRPTRYNDISRCVTSHMI